MIPAPTSFSAGTSHRVAHFFPEAASDFERVEDLLADALGSAREAVSMGHQLDYECFKPVQRWLEHIQKQIDLGRLLNDDFRRPAGAVVASLRENRPSAEACDAHEAMRDRLVRAVQLSHRVSDLLAAERDIGWHRGIRS